MVIHKTPILAFILAASLALCAFSQAQDANSLIERLQGGIDLYSQGRWREAVGELRRVQANASTRTQKAEALYWISLSELSAGEYEAALRDMEAMEALDQANRRISELAYHKGRVYYYLGRYDEAIVLLKNYSDGIPSKPDGSYAPQNASKRASALYWVGECLYSLGLLDKANEVFLLITEEFPRSPKYEASSYRIALINQKRVEAELLGLLKWSHEESLKTMEEYQRREHAYDQALIAYQKRIADMLKDTRLSDLENENAQFRKELAFAQERISGLERDLQLALAGFDPDASRDKKARLEAMRDQASSLINEISSAGRSGR
ncbi:tetratricopeptide repeat protein [Leadbettera azotonutricia]|uniref:Tetratricopeptide repeat domain protein n=1 Tax=Leadbettera azotonutricia (strain ATCC BAA-888 / DSM 13862 / ZAS-9) TaxID=545695 RepID=F5YC43_LEAAZ|nr:tetratricopeptide repeat protein [Leadbettera azotonutricia]AEF83332.1 tetratricopeptide repeat domain protein [Leadbettera azotonutricia ZAS-9]